MKKYLSIAAGVLLSLNALAQDSLDAFKKMETDRTDAYAQQLEQYLRTYLVEEYDARAAKAWNRDYSSTDAFERSVKPNRERWEKVVIKPPVLKKTGPLVKKPYLLDGMKVEWIELPLGGITAQAILAFPANANKNKPVPIVIVQHGIGSSPETAFRDGGYHAYAKGLLKAGYAVVVPMNLRSIERRNRIERLTRLADISLPGIEFARLQHLLDVVLADPRVDPGKVGMWGVSLGGMATMFFMPLEPRIKAGIVSAWFNQRLNKMVLKDERYSCFLETNEDHAFFTGWLTEFTDHDVVSLIAPRPLMVQHGKKDGIAYWPQVIEEFEKSKLHYDKLNYPGRIALTMHDGGHEAIVDAGVSFLDKWLKK